MFNSNVKHIGMVQALVCVLLFANPLSINADSGSFTITPFAGYRGGGDVEDTVAVTELDIVESDTFGLLFGWEVKDGQLEIIYSRQETELTGSS